MSRTRRSGILMVTALAVASLASVPAVADKKIKAHKAQTTHTFVNSESQPAYGLVVKLSAAGEVKTDAESGKAGPFRDIRGNGTASIQLANPDTPIKPGAEAFDLVFGTYQAKITVTNWWWTDTKGKRIGKKKQG